MHRALVGDFHQFLALLGVQRALDSEQRGKLMEIADKCPVHRTLTSEIHIVTHAAD